MVKAAGRVTGTIRYGRLVVEDGGELGGDIRPIGEASNARASSAATATARRDPLKDGIPTLTRKRRPLPSPHSAPERNHGQKQTGVAPDGTTPV